MSKKKERGPKYLVSPLNNPMLNYREYYFSVKEKLLFSAACIGGGGLVGLIFYGGLFKKNGETTNATIISNLIVFAVFGLIALRFAMPSIRASLLNRRGKKLRKQFVDLLEALTTLLASGSTVNDAFRSAAVDLQNHYQQTDMIIIEISEINNGVKNGFTLEEMLIDFGKRSDNRDILSLANVISNCNRLGGDFKSVIRRTRDVISDKIEIEEEIATKLSSNKLQLNAMTLMPIVLVGLLKLSSSSFAENLSSLIGVVVTTIALVLFVVAYFWGQKIVRIS